MGRRESGAPAGCPYVLVAGRRVIVVLVRRKNKKRSGGSRTWTNTDWLSSV